MNNTRPNGFTLIEMLLGVVIIMGALVGVYQLLSRAKINAAVETEQKHLAVIVEGVRGAYMAAAGYEGLTTEDVLNLGISGLSKAEGQLNSSFSGDVLVRPSTAMATNDSFDVVYQELDRRTCIAFTKAAFATSFTIYVGEIGASEGTQVQMTHGAAEGRLVNEPDLIQACSAPQFDSGQGTVAFRFYDKKLGTVDTLDEVCTCTPDVEEQYMSCPPGQLGSVQQRRTSTCTGGTAACPTGVWSSWTTVNNTCALAPAVFIPPGPVPTPSSACIPSVLHRSLPCATGQIGLVAQESTTTCPGPVTGTWATIIDTCATIPTSPVACVPSVDAVRYDPCPVGQGGSITMQRSSTCPNAYGSPVWGTWVATESTCSATCVATGNCCQPTREERSYVTPCANGEIGSIWGEEMNTSSCATATSSPLWAGWAALTTYGSCASCPVNSTNNEVQWVPSSATCPSGQTGTHTWEREQNRTQSVSYDCPSGTTTLPSPTLGSWTAFADTGNTRGEVNTCADEPIPEVCGAQPGSTTRTLSCAPGDVGGIQQASVWTSSAYPQCWVETWVTTGGACTPPVVPSGHTRICMFTSYTSSWSVSSNTCTGGVSSYGLIGLDEGGSIDIRDITWGVMATPSKGTATLICDGAKLDAFVALHGNDNPSYGIGPIGNCPVGGARHDGTPFAPGEQCQFFSQASSVITTTPVTCAPDPVATDTFVAGCEFTSTTFGNSGFEEGGCAWDSSNTHYQDWATFSVRTSAGAAIDESLYRVTMTAASGYPGANCNAPACLVYPPYSTPSWDGRARTIIRVFRVSDNAEVLNTEIEADFTNL